MSMMWSENGIDIEWGSIYNVCMSAEENGLKEENFFPNQKRIDYPHFIRIIDESSPFYKFQPSPNAYLHSTWDQGHPAAFLNHRGKEESAKSCMCILNSAPQNRHMNQVLFAKHLEPYIMRKVYDIKDHINTAVYDTMNVVTGIGFGKKTVNGTGKITSFGWVGEGHRQVAIPDFWYKSVKAKKKDSNVWDLESWLFKNHSQYKTEKKLSHYYVDKSELEFLRGKPIFKDEEGEVKGEINWNMDI